MVEFENVCYEKDGARILKNVTFSLNDGDFAALTGANGAGKSTLLKMFNGLNKPTSGRVTINGADTRKTKTSVLAKTVGFLFQNPDTQICKNTVREEIAFGLTCVGRDRKYINEKCESVIAEFGFSGDKAPFSMSRGERQKLALASILAVEPELLVLDEPTTGLDCAERAKLMDVMRMLNEKGVTVVMATHDMELVMEYARTMLVISDGEIKTCGGVRAVMKDVRTLDAARLLPSQTAGLALELGVGFEDVYTNGEMLERIIERRAAE